MVLALVNCCFKNSMTGVRIELSTNRDSGMGCHDFCLLGLPYIAIGMNYYGMVRGNVAPSSCGRTNHREKQGDESVAREVVHEKGN